VKAGEPGEKQKIAGEDVGQDAGEGETGKAQPVQEDQANDFEQRENENKGGGVAGGDPGSHREALLF
jgi:hypothetical protein